MRTWFWLVVAMGCHKSPAAYEPSYDYGGVTTGGYGGGGGAEGGYYGAPAPTAAPMDESYRESRPRPSRKADSAPAPPPPPPPPPGQPPSTPDAETTTEAPAEAEDRMVHYDGWARLRVANPRETLEAVVAVADEVGGRTENMAGNVVTVRIPVARFDETWTRLLALGDVMDKSVRADDVTEQFTAIDLRVKTLKETQARLVELVARSRDEDEKLRLLQELTRVSEELDALESQLRTLSDLAGFSSITIEAMPREAFTASGGRPPLAGFEWIAGLSPFRHAVWSDDKRIELPTAEGLVGLSTRGPYSAESADGAVVWTYRVPNDPIGTAAFWADAVEDRVAEEFTSPARTRLGAWECLAVDQPASDEPYHWKICVQPVGRQLHVAQVYYPSKVQLERYGAAVDAAIGGEGGGA